MDQYHTYIHPPQLSDQRGELTYDTSTLPHPYNYLCDFTQGICLMPFRQQSPEPHMGLAGDYSLSLCLLWMSSHAQGKSIWASAYTEEQGYCGEFLEQLAPIEAAVQSAMSNFSGLEVTQAINQQLLRISSTVQNQPVQLSSSHFAYTWKKILEFASQLPGYIIIEMYTSSRKKQIDTFVLCNIENNDSSSSAVLFSPNVGELYFPNKLALYTRLMYFDLELRDRSLYMVSHFHPGNLYSPYSNLPVDSRAELRYLTDTTSFHSMSSNLACLRYGGVLTRSFSQYSINQLFSFPPRGFHSAGGLCYSLSIYWIVSHINEHNIWNEILPFDLYIPYFDSSATSSSKHNMLYGTGFQPGSIAYEKSKRQHSLAEKMKLINVTLNHKQYHGEYTGIFQQADRDQTLSHILGKLGLSVANKTLATNKFSLARGGRFGALLSFFKSTMATCGYYLIPMPNAIHRYGHVLAITLTETDACMFDPMIGEFYFKDKANFEKFLIEVLVDHYNDYHITEVIKVGRIAGHAFVPLTDDPSIDVAKPSESS